MVSDGIVKFPKGNFGKADNLYELRLELWIKEKKALPEMKKLKEEDKEAYNERRKELKAYKKVMNTKIKSLAELIVGKKDVEKFLYNVDIAFKEAESNGEIEIEEKSSSGSFIIILILLLLAGGAAFFLMSNKGGAKSKGGETNVKASSIEEGTDDFDLNF